MFGYQRSQKQRFNFGWHIWLLIFVVGLLLFSGQSLFSPVQNQPSQQSSDSANDELDDTSPTSTKDENQVGRGETEESFLAEYDAEAIPFLAENSTDQKPFWMSAGEWVLKLFLVIGLIFLALAGLRWLQRDRIRAATGSATIRVLETTGLAPGRSLHLVVVGEKTLLIGATDHQLSLLAELADVMAPLSEEVSSFDEALAKSKIDNSLTRPLDWQIAFDHLRATVQRIRQHP